jgi:GT2 family glycosyltransferase
MRPKVSFIWINYNSFSFIDLALESLEAIRDLDYSNCELIIVDNGSVDRSLIAIKDFIRRNQIRSKVVELGRNMGFTGGNNAAYATRDAESEYVALLNSDAIPQRDSLKKLVESMEEDKTLGAVQGVILDHDGKLIDTAGSFLSEIFATYPLLEGRHPSSLKKPVYITSADGAYSLYRVDAINKTMGQTNRMFDDFIFACYDDYTLGLKLWNSGYKIKTLPVITARHTRGTSFKKVKPLLAYLYIRNRIILNEISNSRYKNLTRMLPIRQLLAGFFSEILNIGREHGSEQNSRIFIRAVVDGIRIGESRKQLGERIDLYKAPVLLIDVSSVLLGLAISLRLMSSSIERELEKMASSTTPRAHAGNV